MARSPNYRLSKIRGHTLAYRKNTTTTTTTTNNNNNND